jgi:hypothetical protein
MLAGKPFLWDIYRETNGAHLEKMNDFGKFIDEFVDWSQVLQEFIQEKNIEMSLEKLLKSDTTAFEKLSKVLK